MRLRDVEPGDSPAYVRMRCDPAMMAHLGGPYSEERAESQVGRDLALVASGAGMVKMIVVDSPVPETVAGTVALWRHEIDGAAAAEIGWMVLPGHQGQGLARWAVSGVLDEARRDSRWSVVHAFPGVDNAPSNRLCRRLGFTLAGEREMSFRDQLFRINHWVLDLRG
ncbi:GNAT family N-acetyltransferase [Micromonospora inyonensis]|uniref:Protein N-acetyltransferase, RimJ/RimL family n=1 Tax=Micromonospora inyonensis TaxID=47866 RepID=A0A1C6RAE6_9ACTN|nr:GNAT family N-acetyltransferase [Micromonospora inyonensis]SCL14076.1 Protein N-acetyltransferase, RimJ/RimL family [Micromonospora inyonensis]